VLHGPARAEDRGALEVPAHARVAAWRLVDDRAVDPSSCLDLTARVLAEGRLAWDVPHLGVPPE
jgi:hypothetical protein